jgi:hypothetical protein
MKITKQTLAALAAARKMQSEKQRADDASNGTPRSKPEMESLYDHTWANVGKACEMEAAK